MAWNRSSENGEAVSRPLQKRKGFRFPIRGAIAGAIVVVGAAVAAWWLWPAQERGEGAASKEKRLIKEVTPARGPQAEVKQKDPHEGFHLSTTGVWQPNGRPSRPGRKKVHGVFTNQVGRANDSIASNGVEQIMLQIFTRELGDMPMPLPGFIPKKDMDELVAILLDKHPISDKDTESVRMQKETLLAAKQEMLKYVRNGGDPYDFLKFYHNQLYQAFNKRNDTQSFVFEMIRNGESEDVIDAFIKKSNEDLKAAGIRPIHVSPKLYRKEGTQQ